MTFEDEMNQFWKGYSEKKRSKAEGDEAYQSAVKNKDVVKAQERVVAIIHGDFQHRVHPLFRDFGVEPD